MREKKLHIGFLRLSSQGHYYPAVEDDSVGLLDEVLKIMPAPKFDRHGHLLLGGV